MMLRQDGWTDWAQVTTRYLDLGDPLATPNPWWRSWRTSSAGALLCGLPTVGGGKDRDSIWWFKPEFTNRVAVARHPRKLGYRWRAGGRTLAA
jgi:hypothetical protein